jgi:uncharacterized protein with FMN-binding domain
VRARAVVGSILASIAVLVVGWQAGTAVSSGGLTPPVSTPQPQSGGTATTPSPAASTPATPTTPAKASGPADGTYTGSNVDTRFGSVQVQVTLSGGSISDVAAVHLTDADGRSVQISNRAAPVLRQEVLASQSANVSNVSGATYTARAYLSSVQSALDQAGF